MTEKLLTGTLSLNTNKQSDLVLLMFECFSLDRPLPSGTTFLIWSAGLLNNFAFGGKKSNNYNFVTR